MRPRRGKLRVVVFPKLRCADGPLSAGWRMKRQPRAASSCRPLLLAVMLPVPPLLSSRMPPQSGVGAGVGARVGKLEGAGEG